MTYTASPGWENNRGLPGEVLQFCGFLRQAGLVVGTDKFLDTLRSLQLLDICSPEEFYLALRANLVFRQEDLAIFNGMYFWFWNRSTAAQLAVPVDREAGDVKIFLEDNEEIKTIIKRELLLAEDDQDGISNEEETEKQHTLSYSSQEVLSEKDFSALEVKDLQEIQRLLQQVVSRLASAVSRRRRTTSKGDELDLRGSIRRNMGRSGELLYLLRRSPKIKKAKLLLLCDVSGSMDTYTRFFLQFVYGLQRQVSRVETFVFSTRLTRVTGAMKLPTWSRAMAEIAGQVKDWSGGTDIGGCLYELLTGRGKPFISYRNIVIILSDGWDRGETALLARTMRQLKYCSQQIIWLNPLLASTQYEPICTGMKTALPYVDLFLPVHNVASLRNLARILSKVV